MFASFNARALGLTLSADETLRLASENGFGGVDLMVRDLVEQGVDLKALKRKMDDLGLKPGAFPFPFGWRGDGPRFMDDLARLPDYARAAATLGLRRTATWVPPELPNHGIPAEYMYLQAETQDGYVIEPWATWYNHYASRIWMIAQSMMEFGIRLGLEIIGPESSRPGHGPAFVHRYDALETHRIEWCSHFEPVVGDQPRMGILLDTWHLYATGEPLANALACGVENVIWVHVADLPQGDPPDRSKMIDAVRGLPGENGAIDSRAALAALMAGGYDGPVTAEPLSRCRSLAGLAPAEVARAAARSLRAVWPESAHAARPRLAER